MSSIVVRNYRDADLPSIVRLYDLDGIEAPYFLKDKNYISYFISHPGVRQDSIFVAASEHGIEGLAIIAIVQRSYTVGRIIELRAREVPVANALLQKAIEYCRDNSVDAVEISPPTSLDSDNTFADWLRMDQGGVLMAKPLSLLPLLQAVFNTEAGPEIKVRKSFLFACDTETVEVKITRTEVSIIERDKSWEGSDNTILIRVSLKTLLEMIFGLTKPCVALLTGRVKIRNIGSFIPAMMMLRAIRIKNPWTVAIADER